MTFSIIIPVCHGGRFLREVLASLGELQFPAEDMEVLVCGGEADTESRGCVEAAASRSRSEMRYIPEASALRPVRLNAACAQTRGRVLAFVDDDCVIPRGWLSELLQAVEQSENLGILGGSDELVYSGEPFDLALDWVLNSFVGSGGCRTASGLRLGKAYPKLWNMAVPKDVALRVALPDSRGRPQVFDESLSVHEDVDLARRIEEMGRGIVHAPQVRVCHARDTTFGSFLRRNFDMARICRRVGVHRLPHRVLAGSVVAAGFLGVAAVFSPASRVVLVLTLAAYCALLGSSAAWAARATGRALVAAHVPLLLLGAHLARGTGYLLPWAANRDRPMVGETEAAGRAA